MSEKTNPNDPVTVSKFQGGFFGEGLTKREYFAAVALQGMATRQITFQSAVRDSVRLADLLIEQLNR